MATNRHSPTDPRNWPILPDGRKIPVWQKDPNDEEDYTLDWAIVLAPGDELASVEVFVPKQLTQYVEPAVAAWRDFDPSNLELSDTKTLSTCWLAGGHPVEGTRLECLMRGTTKLGRKHDWPFHLISAHRGKNS